jgi:hypothetical protein
MSCPRPFKTNGVGRFVIGVFGVVRKDDREPIPWQFPPEPTTKYIDLQKKSRKVIYAVGNNTVTLPPPRPPTESKDIAFYLDVINVGINCCNNLIFYKLLKKETTA